jgi:hypothetical protein
VRSVHVSAVAGSAVSSWCVRGIAVFAQARCKHAKDRAVVSSMLLQRLIGKGHASSALITLLA